jgi:hypothetical protein
VKYITNIGVSSSRFTSGDGDAIGFCGGSCYLFLFHSILISGLLYLHFGNCVGL